MLGMPRPARRGAWDAMSGQIVIIFHFLPDSLIRCDVGDFLQLGKGGTLFSLQLRILWGLWTTGTTSISSSGRLPSSSSTAERFALYEVQMYNVFFFWHLHQALLIERLRLRNAFRETVTFEIYLPAGKFPSTYRVTQQGVPNFRLLQQNKSSVLACTLLDI